MTRMRTWRILSCLMSTREDVRCRGGWLCRDGGIRVEIAMNVKGEGGEEAVEDEDDNEM